MTILRIVLDFELCRSGHFGVLTQIRHFLAYCLALGVGAYHRGLSSELNESDRGTCSSAEQNTKLATHLLDDQHSELYCEREQFLRPPSFQHRANSFEKSYGLPSTMVGSYFEHEQFCTPRSSFEAPREQSNCNEGAKASPT